MKRFWHLGLIGWPLTHSLSPLMHSAALRHAGMDGTYSLFPVAPQPDNNSGLTDLLVRVKNNELDGLNVTIPHKQSVIPLLDNLTPAARAIGAVNTVWLEGNRLTGDNTDWSGFHSDLILHLPENRTGHHLQRALVLGAGGSARAVVYALSHSGWQVSILARRLEQAKLLADDLSTSEQSVNVVTIDGIRELESISLVVNTTPAGMSPNISDSPWPAGLDMPSNAVVYDLIYNPAETTLMKNAEFAGLATVNGLGMLASQAARAFEIWTNTTVPTEVFLEAALERKLS